MRKEKKELANVIQQAGTHICLNFAFFLMNKTKNEETIVLSLGLISFDFPFPFSASHINCAKVILETCFYVVFLLYFLVITSISQCFDKKSI